MLFPEEERRKRITLQFSLGEVVLALSVFISAVGLYTGIHSKVAGLEVTVSVVKTLVDDAIIESKVQLKEFKDDVIRWETGITNRVERLELQNRE